METKNDKTVLTTILEILKFKNFTTIGEIAKISGLRQAHVLRVLNRNISYVIRDPTNGHIRDLSHKSTLRTQLWNSGRYYSEDVYGMFSKEGDALNFAGNDELRGRLSESKVVGAFGDSGTQTVIIDTPENRKAIEDAGLRPWSEVVIDDRLWEEPA